MAHELADNVVVKWEAYREWVDEVSKRTRYRWEMRVCVVPKEYEEAVRGITPDPDRAFLDVPHVFQGRPATIIFPFKTLDFEGVYDKEPDGKN